MMGLRKNGFGLLACVAAICVAEAVCAETVVTEVDLQGLSELPLVAADVGPTADSVRLRVRQNGLVALPLAVANRSAADATYRVTLDGGLPGFPVRQIAYRRVVTDMASSKAPGMAPVLAMDAAGCVSASAGTCALVILEFDAKDVFPRTYRGTVRIVRVDVPEPALTVPLALEVLPDRLPDVTARIAVAAVPVRGLDELRLMQDLGVFDFALDPARLAFARGADGSLDLTAYPKVLQDLDADLERTLSWKKATGRPCRWLLKGDVRAAVRRLYGLKEGTAEDARLWAEWRKAVVWKFTSFGFAEDDFTIDDGTANPILVRADEVSSRALGIALPNVRSLAVREEILRRRAAQAELEIAASDEADVVIYGATSAGLAAAVQARRMGRSCLVIEPTARIGGLTTGGLGSTDIGNKDAFGGLSLRFYRDIGSYYADPANWVRQDAAGYFNCSQSQTAEGEEAMWSFEPSAALKVLEAWEKAERLTIVRGERLDRSPGKVKVEGEGERRKIVSIVTESGRVFRGKVFIDASYEGDLLAAAGVSYTVGREANAVYGETVNGMQRARAKSHQLSAGVSGYRIAGDPSSGLLPGVEKDDDRPDGSGDRRVQAYCYRMCLTDDPENRIPFARPANYREEDYELLFRDPPGRCPWGNTPMPNRKTDTNNNLGFSTDLIGGNWDYPEASYAERARIEQTHLDYQKGLMWTLANHPRVPEVIRREVSRWGTCRDEFVGERGDGWQNQLYVREARRMVGAYVMTEANCRGSRRAMRSVALAAYTMDSHHVRRYLDAEGFVHNEGDIQERTDANGDTFAPYPIDYGALTPKRGECANLLVPVCLSASHIAFGSIRMEPVFFALGQAAGTAAAFCAADGIAVQDLKYARLRDRLLQDGQVLK